MSAFGSHLFVDPQKRCWVQLKESRLLITQKLYQGTWLSWSGAGVVFGLRLGDVINKYFKCQMEHMLHMSTILTYGHEVTSWSQTQSHSFHLNNP